MNRGERRKIFLEAKQEGAMEDEWGLGGDRFLIKARSASVM
jgi:hypothetical protein